MFDDVIQKRNAYHRGWQEGFDEGVLEAMRQGVLDLVQECFPEVLDLARRQIVCIEDTAILRRLILKIFLARSTEEVERYILEDDRILRKGFEEGLRQERYQSLRRQRQILINFVEARFPDILPLLRKCLKMFNDPDILQDLALRMFPMRDSTEAEQYLQNILEANSPEG